MKNIILNGRVYIYDETLKAGDLISAYQSGYHVFVKFQIREGTTPLAYYVTRFTKEGKAVNSNKEYTCDASYCRKAKDHIEARIKELQLEIANLESIQDALT